MSKNDKPKTLNWLEFQAMGNPENVPDINPNADDDIGEKPNRKKMVVRVYLERKNRGGKTVSIVKGVEESDDELKKLCKTLKTKCGVGGNAKNGEIVLQGDHRGKIVDVLISMGYSNTKNAGA